METKTSAVRPYVLFLVAARTHLPKLLGVHGMTCSLVSSPFVPERIGKGQMRCSFPSLIKHKPKAPSSWLMFCSFSFLCWEHATNTSIIEVEYDLTKESSLISHYKSRLLVSWTSRSSLSLNVMFKSKEEIAHVDECNQNSHHLYGCLLSALLG
jgi:hypothetical protein